MQYQPRDLERIARGLSNKLSEELDRIGLLYRIFYRSKSSESIARKRIEKQYESNGRFMRDVIGLRINLYFSDDLRMVYRLAKNQFNFIEETIDKNDETVFKPTRVNVIFRLPGEWAQEFKTILPEHIFDDSFELQLRTILSEGWHEVDHDLRYKHPAYWQGNSDLSRTFNGILAALETSDWSIIQIFDELAYRHYKAGQIEAMIRTKYRLRVLDNKMSSGLSEYLRNSPDLVRSLYKLDREEFLNQLIDKNIFIPLTIDNLVFILNELIFKIDAVTAMTPPMILSRIKLKTHEADLSKENYMSATQLGVE